VDDYQDAREMYAAYLSYAGFDSVKARDGFEALQVASHLLPDVILMDLGLPGIDGCEVTRRLKEDTRTAHIPVIALTAQALAREAERYRARGFENLLLKPCLPDDLAEELLRVIDRDRAKRESTPPSAPQPRAS
jgi:CheY-like chemotaxis protein